MLELLVAMTVGALVIAGLARGLASALVATRAGRTTVQSSLLASERLEEVRGIGWGDGLAHRSGGLASAPEVVGGQFDPDAAGPLAPEDIVYNDNGDLATHLRTSTDRGIVFTVKVFITDAATARRATAVVEWSEGSRARMTRLGTLINPLPTTLVGGGGGSGDGSAAFLVSGKVPSDDAIAPVGLVQAPPDDEESVATSSPAPEITGSASTTLARASGGTNRAAATIGSLALSLPGLTVEAESISVEVVSSAPGATPTMSGSGSVIVNGTSYADPAPNTLVNVGPWRIILNSQRAEADGSRTVAYILIVGPGTELTAAYAWARPA